MEFVQVNGFDLLVRFKSKNPKVFCSGRTSDKEYQFVTVDQAQRIHKQYKQWAWFHGVTKWVKNSNDCDDMAWEYIRYMRRKYKKSGKAVSACVLYSRTHAVLGLVNQDGTFTAIEPVNGVIIGNFDAVEMAGL